MEKDLDGPRVFFGKVFLQKIVNIFSLAPRTVSVLTPHLLFLQCKSSLNNMETNGHGYVTRKLYLQKNRM